MKNRSYKAQMMGIKRVSLITVVVLLLLSMQLLAQSPNSLSYQVVIRNETGTLMQNTNVGLQISILQGSTDGTAVYVEKQRVKTNNNGLVTLQIGSASGGSSVPTKTMETDNTATTSGDFSSIDWSHGPYFIKVEIDPTGGTDYTITGISQLLSVPYALYAKNAGTASNNKQTLSEVAANGNSVNTQLKNVGYPTDENDAATKLYVDALFRKIANLETALQENNISPSVTDIDGNTYKTTIIGNQVWMAENLKVTREPNGTPVYFVKEGRDEVQWEDLHDSSITKAYCFYDNDTASPYGALYTYEAAKSVCPTGWHLPTNEDWDELKNFVSQHLGNYHGIGDALKSKSWTGNSDADGFGFSALPGGYRNFEGRFQDKRESGYWWSGTPRDSLQSWYRYIDSGYDLNEGKEHEFSGLSIRCIKN
jgi:uncharacterized protein (TIGR02145 family)